MLIPTTTNTFVSGNSISVAQLVAPFFSGGNWTATTEETISGVRAVTVSQAGNIRVAMASVSGRMPAIGIVVDNVLSGIQTNVYSEGMFQFTSGLANYSGYIGTQLYVGRSGQVVSISGSFNSGGILSGDVSQPIGTVVNSGGGVFSVAASLPVVLGLITSGMVASGQLDQFILASGAVSSGQVASGAVIGQAGGGAFNIGSGTVGTFDIGSGAIRSGHIASGQVSNFAIGSGAVTSGRIGMGGTPTGTNFFRDDFSWQAAALASGGIVQVDFGSGVGSEYGLQFVSGLTNPTQVITEETISGYRAVCLSQSGNIRIAMASVSGRMPAVGVVIDNVASGIQCNVWNQGNFQFASGMADYSGFLGQILYVGRSGQVVTASGSWNSGGLLSGDYWQPIGTPLNSGQAALDMSIPLMFLVNTIQSGNIGSGQIGGVHLASGAITSGVWVGSGSLYGRLGPQFQIASGTIGTFDIGSGQITSGLLASGQVGPNALASGIITSGFWLGSGAVEGRFGGGPFHIASGSIGTFDISSGGVVSGNIASGQIDINHHASGYFARAVAPVQSGGINTLKSLQMISGVKAVSINPSGNVQIAMAALSGTMPACGIVIDNVASGINCTIHMMGFYQLATTAANYSGYVGRRVLVGMSGEVVQISGSFLSGGPLSGALTQVLGTIVNSGGILLNVYPALFSGFPPGAGIDIPLGEL